MVAKATSKHRTKLQIHVTEDSKLEQALAEVKAQDSKPKHEQQSVRQIADKYCVPRSTLQRRVNGVQSRAALFGSHQKVTPVEEDVLAKTILELADRGFPPTRSRTTEMANLVLKSRYGTGFRPVGIHWVDRFLDRQAKILASHWSKPLDTLRAQSLNSAAVMDWFVNVVKPFIVDHQVEPENIYGMDETGFQLGDTGTRRVIGRRGNKCQHKQSGGDRENITVIITISASGDTLPPTIIFKGANIMKKWGERNVANASFACSPNGWTDSDLALNWLMKDFDALTRDRAKGKTRVLILDGHNSHHTGLFLRYAKEQDIIIIGYPPHTTHALQGLDVVCFSHLKDAYRKELEKFEELNHGKAAKHNFAFIFGTAFLRAFTKETVQAAFRATGIYPYNPTVISPHQMKPSIPHSIKAPFPLPHATPARRVMAANHYSDPESSNSTISDTDNSIVVPRPTHCQYLDPSKYTPTKRVQALVDSLSESESASHLVAEGPISSNQRLPGLVLEAIPEMDEPEWALTDDLDDMATAMQWKLRVLRLQRNLTLARQHVRVRDAIIEGTHAQLVLQGYQIDKLHQSLNHKEQKKKADRTKLFPGGRGRHLTGDDFINVVEQAEAVKKSKENEKETRKALVAERKDKQAEIDQEWAGIQQHHQENVAAWKEKCEQLTADGIPKRRHPKCPKCPLKPKLPEHLIVRRKPSQRQQVVQEASSSGDEEDWESEDDN